MLFYRGHLRKVGKIEIFKRYHRDMLKLDSIFEKVIEKLEKLSRELILLQILDYKIMWITNT